MCGLREEDAVSIVSGLSGSVGRGVLSMCGFVVFEGGHDGVFGWWDCKRFVESSGLEHFFTSV